MGVYSFILSSCHTIKDQSGLSTRVMETHLQLLKSICAICMKAAIILGIHHSISATLQHLINSATPVPIWAVDNGY